LNQPLELLRRLRAFTLGRAVSKFIPADDLIVPYSATSLDDADAIVHVISMSENDLRKQQVGGFYRDIELGEPPITENQIKEKEREIQGVRKNDQNDQYTILEMHVDLDLPGFEDVDPATGEPLELNFPMLLLSQKQIQKFYLSEEIMQKTIQEKNESITLYNLNFYQV